MSNQSWHCFRSQVGVGVGVELGVESALDGTKTCSFTGYFCTNSDESFAPQSEDEMLSFTMNSTCARWLTKSGKGVLCSDHAWSSRCSCSDELPIPHHMGRVIDDVWSMPSKMWTLNWDHVDTIVWPVIRAGRRWLRSFSESMASALWISYRKARK
jgi:hypothetical protein